MLDTYTVFAVTEDGSESPKVSISVVTDYKKAREVDALSGNSVCTDILNEGFVAVLIEEKYAVAARPSDMEEAAASTRVMTEDERIRILYNVCCAVDDTVQKLKKGQTLPQQQMRDLCDDAVIIMGFVKSGVMKTITKH